MKLIRTGEVFAIDNIEAGPRGGFYMTANPGCGKKSYEIMPYRSFRINGQTVSPVPLKVANSYSWFIAK